MLLVCARDAGAQAEQVRLTDYVGQAKLGSTPYLVKLEEDRFLVLWEEFTYYETEAGYYGVRDDGVRWVEVGGSGQVFTGIQTLERARLSYDCQPVVARCPTGPLCASAPLRQKPQAAPPPATAAQYPWGSF